MERMNLVTFSFVLVTLIDGLPLNKKPEVLMESMEFNGSEVLMNSTNSSAEWFWPWGPQEDYQIGSMINESQLAAHLELTLYSVPTEQPSVGPHVNQRIVSLDLSIPLTTHTKDFLQSAQFNKNAKTIWMSHGYNANSDTCTNDFVSKYLALGSPGDYQVVCVDWSYWAHQNWNVFNIFNAQAKECVDVGYYLGIYLDQFVTVSGIDHNKLHLIGHSLGAHIVGLMGRTFTGLTQKTLPRVTGLDPAGPLFVRNKYGLKTHMIKNSDATFVDIIHSCGDMNPYASQLGHASKLGDLHQLGDADFYPNGGSMQPQCVNMSVGILGRSGCAHSASARYYIESIGLDKTLYFATVTCDSVSACNHHAYLGNLEASKYNGNNHMGFHAVKPANPTLYYLDIEDPADVSYSHCCQ